MTISNQEVRQNTKAFSRGKLILVASVALLLAAIYSHIWVNGNEDYTGPLALLDRCFDIGLAFGITAVAFCVGRRVSRTLSLDFSNVAEEISVSIMLGTGFMALGVLAIGLLGLLRPLPIAALILVILTLTRKELVSLSIAVNQAIGAATATRRQRAIALAYVALVLLLILRTATPPWMPDDTIYHLPVTKAFVLHGRVYPLYDNSLGNMPFLVHMIYVLCLLAKSDIATKLFSLILALTTSLALFAFCARFLNRNMGLVAMFGFLAAAMVVEVAVTARIDVSLAGTLFLASYALIVYFDTGQKSWFYASSIFAGFSLGIKLTAIPWLGLLVAMFLAESIFRRREKFIAVAKMGLIYLTVLAVVASPWFIKNLVWFHNPVYPFITGEVAEFAEGKIRYFNSDDERKLDLYFDMARQKDPERVQIIAQSLVEEANARLDRHPFRFWEFYTTPSKYLMSDFRHYPNYMFLVVPFYFMLRRSQWLTWLLALSVVFYLFIVWSSWLARFLLPIYPALTLVSAFTLVEVRNGLYPRFRVAAKLPMFVLAASLTIPLVVSIATIAEMKNIPFFVGSVSRSEFLSALPEYPVMQFINKKLPPDARVMSIGTQMCYHMHRDYLAEESWDSTEWRRLLVHNNSLEEVDSDLRRQGITHIVFSPSLFRFAARMGRRGSGGVEHMSESKHGPSEAGSVSTPDRISLRNWATFDLYSSTFLELIYSDENQYFVYRLK